MVTDKTTLVILTLNQSKGKDQCNSSVPSVCSVVKDFGFDPCRSVAKRL